MNVWNFIGVFFDYDFGIVCLWYDGNEVEVKYIGRKLELVI